MPDLIAQGPRQQDRWRRPLSVTNAEAVLGRTADHWSVPWDDRISRKHASLRWNGKTLEVTRFADARNFIFYRGQQLDNFKVQIGEHFVIGQTTFTIVDQPVQFSQLAAPAFSEQTYSPHLLRQSRYRDADRRIEVLGRVPEIIAGSSSDEELCARIVNVLLLGISDASFVAIVKRLDTNSTANRHEFLDPSSTAPAIDGDTESDRQLGPESMQILHWDCRSLTGQQFKPSGQLVGRAVRTKESVLHIWNRSQATDAFTQSENVDWAFCTPVLSDACPGWAIYVSGVFASPTIPEGVKPESDGLRDDLKFAELTATTLGAIKQVRSLQRRQDSLRPFFAPVVLEALSQRDPDEVLAPRETDVSVLFCDLRGFSRNSEDSADRLLDLLARVSDALGIMTHHILHAGGVVGDFHGDAAMGFWGWPISDQQAIHQACAAALAIRLEFDRNSGEPGHPLAGFRAGIGIASGPAVAGRIGTIDQVKVTVFGPVVNLASRLEGMTKQLQTPILIDEATADWIRKHVPRDVLRVRRVAKVRPYGMQTSLMVSELLPPAEMDGVLTDEHIEVYETALDHFLAGRWPEAFRYLHQVPAEDQVKDFLVVYIAQHRRTPPPDWAGIIELPAK
ncbi:MAG: adenylate/guanylate cyclase domain-containing protein [Pirellulaceae bacterium]|nr:adenylate/guanylate cyclase domain-containing protein [Pirellulaceae bacterium]